MGNMMKKGGAGGGGGGAQGGAQQGMMYAAYPQTPMVQAQPMMPAQGTPMYAQQPGVQAYQPVAAQAPQYVPVQPAPQLRPMTYAQPQPSMASYQPGYPSPPSLAPRYPPPPVSSPLPLSLPYGQNQNTYENDAFLSNLTGWSIPEIERLRHEFMSYANSYGVIDREGFRKLYVASLLNMTWQALERDSEAAFRNFDVNQTGALDFNEYITACARMARETSYANQPAYPSATPAQPAALGPSMSGSYPPY